MRYAFALMLALPVAVAAQTPNPALPTGGALTDRIVNDPRPAAFSVYGLRLPPRVRADKTVQFGKAVRVPIDSDAPPDHRIGVTSLVLKPIKKGDRLVVAFWARAQETEGGAPGKIARVRFEEARQPHRPIFAQPVVVGGEWRLHQVSGVADADFAAQQLQVALHLAGAKQVIDVGPVFIMRYGG